MPTDSRASGRRTIVVVTGTRAEYGLLRSPMRALLREPTVRLRVIATGTHLLRALGNTQREIERDGFEIAARVRMQRGDDRPLDQAQGLARGVAGIARALHRLQTDVVLVLGDRIEALAGALAGVTTGCVVAHIHGGDVAEGDFDESIRHAITKLAHVHFVASRQSRARVLALGEPRARVHRVGAPGLDELRPLVRARSRTGRAAHPPTALIVQHAYGRPTAVEKHVMQTVLQCVAEAGLRRVIVCPNSDRGHSGVRAAIERHRRTSPPGEVTVVHSLPRSEFLRRLSEVDLLIGNSSSGIIEAPYLGTPSVDVGRRQRGRQPGGPSVIAAGENPRAIRRALRQARQRKPRSARGPYGDGRAGGRIARILAGLKNLEELRRKSWPAAARSEP